ncbi:MAG TPA: helix-turn-helix transcriptional regulator [Bacillota bacterium]|nr:helix-turn-helix transcriptional regulator [Bacillota bacterium]HPT88695.1 helix-turn-helix transcriptional regulator [Bacillota bacterium]
MKFGEKIKQFRLEKGLTQAGLAEVIGSTREKIQKYENGVNEPSLEVVVRLADFFQVCVDQLIREDWTCPLVSAEIATVARKAAQLSEREIEAVHKLVDKLGENPYQQK